MKGLISWVFGRCGRDETEVASKMAELLDASLDFLVGKTDVLIDKQIFKSHHRDSEGFAR